MAELGEACSVCFLFLEKMKTMVTNIYLRVVFALLSLYSLALVTLIVKKVNHWKNKNAFALNL